ncbi:MAG: glycosyltransferase family 39 protein, partial [Candidatus Wallbacteria bacterium]|nr:glycosyltransferase family 39 protein [Candidatus Wallbacteria bacterium]
VLPGILSRDPTPDETATFISTPQLVWSNFTEGLHPPLYFGFMLLYKKIFPSSLAWLRLFSMLCGALTLLLFHRMFRLAGLNTAWTLFLAAVPGFIFLSREASCYAFHILTATAVLYFYLEFLKGRHGRILFFLCLAACYSYYYHFFFLTALLIDFALIRRRALPWRALFIFTVLLIPLGTILAWNPFFHGMAASSNSALTISKPAVGEFPARVISRYMLFFPGYHFMGAEKYAVLPAGIAVVSASAALFLIYGNNSMFRAGVLFAVPWILLVMFSLVSTIRLNRYAFFPYHLAPFLPASVLLAALNTRNSLPRVITAVVLFAAMLAADGFYFFDETLPFQNKNELSRMVSLLSAKDYSPTNDLLFACHTWEWGRVSFADQLRIVNPDLSFITLEEFADQGSGVFFKTGRIFEFAPLFLEEALPSPPPDRPSDPRFLVFSTVSRAREALALSHTPSEVLRACSSGSLYILRIWEPRN